MKKTIYHILNLLSLVVMLFAGIACEDEKVQDTRTPEFPEAVSQMDVEPGTFLTFSITPNMDWKIEIPEESYRWFMLMDGKYETSCLYGEASDEPVMITVRTAVGESFSSRSCSVMMTMGEQTQEVARYSLRAADREFKVYAASVVDGVFEVFDGNYVYEEEQMTEINLVWDEDAGRFYFPVRVCANCGWTVEWPSWVRADVNTIRDTTDIDIYSISSQLPLDGDAGVIRFKNGEQELATYNVNIPGCRDKFDFNLSRYTSLTFDHASYFHSESGVFSKDAVNGYIYGPSEARVVVLELTADGYVQPESSWLNVEIEAWDSVTGSDVLQSRDLSVTAERSSETEDRQAVILFLPATVSKDISEVLTDGGKQISADYQDYAVPVLQKARPAEYLTFEEEQADIESVGIIFKKAESDLLPEKSFEFVDGLSSWQYELSYTKDVSSSKSTVFLTEPFESYTVYDAAGNEIEEGSLSEHWLDFTLLRDNIYGQVMMDSEKIDAETENPQAMDGYIVFKGEDHKVLSIIHCFYVAEVKTEQDVLEDVSETMFADPASASASGASIYKVISGPTYETWKETSVNIYKLQYTVSDTKLDVKTSEDVYQYQCAGKWWGPEMVNIDDDNFDESQGFVLEWSEKLNKYVGTYDGVTSIRMTYSESYSEVIEFYDADNAVLFIIICELKIK